MSNHSSLKSKRRSFNLFDALVVAVLLVGLPLGYWAYSAGRTSLSVKYKNTLYMDIPGPEYASSAFRVTTENEAVLKTALPKLVEGEMIYDHNERWIVGVIREVTLTDKCYKVENVETEFCPVKIVFDLRCVEGDSKVKCVTQTLRVHRKFEIVTQLVELKGLVVDLQRLSPPEN